MGRQELGLLLEGGGALHSRQFYALNLGVECHEEGLPARFYWQFFGFNWQDYAVSHKMCATEHSPRCTTPLSS